MYIQLELLLAACTVNLVLQSVHSHNQMIDQMWNSEIEQAVNDKNEIHKNVQNLFDSIANNNVRKSETYREFLKQDIAKEQQAFDVLKDELWVVRNRDTYKNADFYKKIHISENSVPAKRQTIKKEPSGVFTKEGFPVYFTWKQPPEAQRVEDEGFYNNSSGDMFKKFQRNWIVDPEAPWPELKNMTLHSLKSVCRQVLAGCYQTRTCNATLARFTYVDLPSGQLARRVVKKASVKFENGIKHMTLLKCLYDNTDFYLARIDKENVFRMEKDVEGETKNTFYFRDGPYRIQYDMDYDSIE